MGSLSGRRIGLALFAAGDFAFNLYWQSTTFFLLFYYTDALGMPITEAGRILALTSVWDGLANLLAGMLLDRGLIPRLGSRVLAAGSVPLGIAFLLSYCPPLPGHGWTLAVVIFGNLLFRGFYAWLNIAYLALSAQVAARTADRAFLAGARMLFGTAAAVLVALATRPLGAWLAGAGPSLYAAAALVFAGCAVLILATVGMMFRQVEVPLTPSPSPLARTVASLAGNRAFVTLNLAMMAMTIGVTVLNKSILYYFKYSLGSVEAGQLALASMSVVSAFAVPGWTALAGSVGGRGVWFLATAGALGAIGSFIGFGAQDTQMVQLFLIGLQAAVIGLHFSYWAMLPDTIEYGERNSGVRLEGSLFGLSALLSRLSIGAATAILTIRFGAAGYRPNVAQTPGALAAMRWTIALVPFVLLSLAAVLMVLNPLRRGVHDRVLEELGRGPRG